MPTRSSSQEAGGRKPIFQRLFPSKYRLSVSRSPSPNRRLCKSVSSFFKTCCPCRCCFCCCGSQTDSPPMAQSRRCWCRRLRKVEHIRVSTSEPPPPVSRASVRFAESPVPLSTTGRSLSPPDRSQRRQHRRQQHKERRKMSQEPPREITKEEEEVVVSSVDMATELGCIFDRGDFIGSSATITTEPTLVSRSLGSGRLN